MPDNHTESPQPRTPEQLTSAEFPIADPLAGQASGRGPAMVKWELPRGTLHDAIRKECPVQCRRRVVGNLCCFSTRRAVVSHLTIVTAHFDADSVSDDSGPGRVAVGPWV